MCRLLYLFVFGLPRGMELDMAILLVALVSQGENYVPVGKMARVMVSIVLLNTLPAHIHNVAVMMSIDRFDNLATSHTETAIDMAHNVRPQRPGANVPGLVGLDVHGGPVEGSALGQGLAVGGELLDECVAGEGHVAGDDELAEDGLQTSVLGGLLEVLVLGEVVPYCGACVSA